MSRPLAFGYAVERVAEPMAPTVPLPVSRLAIAMRPQPLSLFFDETAISRFASREGFELAHVYRDRAPDATSEPSRRGFEAMIDAAQGREDVTAVIIATDTHLGANATAQASTRRRLERDAGLLVLAVRLGWALVMAVHADRSAAIGASVRRDLSALSRRPHASNRREAPRQFSHTAALVNHQDPRLDD